MLSISSFRATLALSVCALALTACLDDLKIAQGGKQEPLENIKVREPGYTGPQINQPTTAPTTRDALHATGFVAEEPQPYYRETENRENYKDFDDNPVRVTAKDPVSTFSVDVDTVSYSNARRILNAGGLPPMDAVRVEEMINYFDYGYAPPEDPAVPFSVTTEVAPTPWNSSTYLLTVGIQGYEVDEAERPGANLVFLIDVSGSMDSPDKLPLLVNAFKMLTQQLTEKDTVSIVVYAGAAGVVLEPTKGNAEGQILRALSQLKAGGSTAGGEGIQLAYALAEENFVEGGINRVILATDGDFNIGVTNFEMLTDMVARYREKGVELTTLGFGTGNYNEALLEQLADVGNGNAFYIDTLNEARKVLVEELSATLFTIARDVKIQIEFNPNVVAEYRLIGYENRVLKTEDFKNDKVDAGDIGAGHTVTAVYEIVLVGSDAALVDPLRYGGDTAGNDPAGEEFAHLRLRYKLPGEDKSKLIERPLLTADITGSSLETASDDFRFAVAVAAFGQLLRGGTYLGDFGYDDVVALARGAKGEDRYGYRAEFVNIVQLAEVHGS